MGQKSRILDLTPEEEAARLALMPGVGLTEDEIQSCLKALDEQQTAAEKASAAFTKLGSVVTWKQVR